MLQKKDLFKTLAEELKKRDNPTDLKPAIIGKVVNLEPLTVAIEEENVFLKYGESLYISEWFKFRCDIDKNKELSEEVPQLLEKAQGVKETHSYGGAPCVMPEAIVFLSQAITIINNEIIAFKCDLKNGDLVILNSAEQEDTYILIDKYFKG